MSSKRLLKKNTLITETGNLIKIPGTLRGPSYQLPISPYLYSDKPIHQPQNLTNHIKSPTQLNKPHPNSKQTNKQQRRENENK